MIKKIIDKVDSTGLYGAFSWDSFFAGGDHPMNGQVPIGFYIEVTGNASIRLKSSASREDTPLPVAGGYWTSSVYDGLFVSLEVFWFEIQIISGTVSVWIKA